MDRIALNAKGRSTNNRALGENDRRSATELPTGRVPLSQPLLFSRPGVGAIDDVVETEADRVGNALVDNRAAPLANGAMSGSRLSQAPSGRGGGDSLPADLAQSWGRQLNTDLSAIHVHPEDKSALDIGAKAYTEGAHVHFAPGEYRPYQHEGRRLLAHEVAHTLQTEDGLIRREPLVRRIEVIREGDVIRLYVGERVISLNDSGTELSVANGEYQLIPTQVGSGYRLYFDSSNQEEYLFATGNYAQYFSTEQSVTVVVVNSEEGLAGSTDTETQETDTESQEEGLGGSGSSEDDEDHEQQGEGDRQGEESNTEQGEGGNPPAESSDGGLTISSQATEADRVLVLRVLRELHGDAEAGEVQALSRFVTLREVMALRLLDQHPRRIELMRMMQSGRAAPGESPPQGYDDMIETVVAQLDLQEYGNQFDFQFDTDEDARGALVPRPVRGSIVWVGGEQEEGQAVPGKEVMFEFQVLDNVDRFAVPHVYIRWFAARRRAEGMDASNVDVLEEETVNYSELDPDSLLNDRRFEMTFDDAGTYEIHAFVNHSFFRPAHFSKVVEVRTSAQRLDDMESDTEESFGEAGDASEYQFESVEQESFLVRLGLGVASPTLSIPALIAEDSDAQGLRRTGLLDPSVLNEAGFANSTAHIEGQLERVRNLVRHYERTDQEDMLEWAQQRETELENLLARIHRLRATDEDTSAGSVTHPIAARGYYVSRRSGVPSGQLYLVCWFTYNESEGVYYGHLLDHSEIVRPENFHFEAEDSDFEAMMEELFFELTSTYPNGRMRFSFQSFEGTLPTQRFIQYERKTDTLLNDIQESVFSSEASLVVNVVATVLSVFPPTAPVGIGLSIVYNGADAGLNFADAHRSGTVRASNYVDLGLVALDILPVIGRADDAARLIRVGEGISRQRSLGQRALDITTGLTQYAGNFYVFNDQAWQQIGNVRSQYIDQLSQLREEINVMREDRSVDPQLLARKRQEMARLEQRARDAAISVFSEMAGQQMLQMGSQHFAGRLAHGLATRRAGGAEIDVPGDGATEGQSGPPNTDPNLVIVEEARRHETEADPDAQMRRRPAEAPLEIAGTDTALAEGLPPSLRTEIPVVRISEGGGTVKVRYDRNAGGGVGRIWIEAGPNATVDLVRGHLPAVQVLQRYQGMIGTARTLLLRARGLLGGRFSSWQRAIELEGELAKLPGLIADQATLLNERRASLSEAEIVAHEERIRSFEQQLEQHRLEWSMLDGSQEARGFIAAKDQIFQGMRQEISGSTRSPETRHRAQGRRIFAESAIVDAFLRLRRSLRREAVAEGDTHIPTEDLRAARSEIADMVYDDTFGDAALEQARREVAALEREGRVRHRDRTTISMADYFQRLLGILRRANQRRRERQHSADLHDAIAAHRERTGIERGVNEEGDVTGGTVAAGVLVMEGESRSSRGIEEVFTGGSSRARAEGESADPSYRPLTREGQPISDPQFAGHAEQSVVGGAARALREQFPNTDPVELRGELRMHAEQIPCSTCQRGLIDQRGTDAASAALGPLARFSRDFPNITLVITYNDRTTQQPTRGVLTIRNGEIISNTGR